MVDKFWEAIAAQCDELAEAESAADVLRILAKERNPYGPGSLGGGDDGAFFAGSGGERSVLGALYKAGWAVKWMDAPYYYAMTAPNGDVVTYIEGDIFGRDVPPGR